jgi:flagellin
MSLVSINTNIAASIALESLNSTATQLQSVQKQISTGYRVADATDDGAAFAVAQRVRSDVGALTSANQQLGNAQGLLSTTLTGLTDVSNTLNSARDVLVKLADSSTTGSERTQYIAQYKSLVANVKSDLADASYNGRTLIGNIGGASATAVNVVRNENGATYNIATFSGSALVGSISFTSTQLQGASTVAALIGTSASAATFINQINSVGSELSAYGSATNYVTNQVTYNSDKIDALNNGLGALIDANLAQESAQLTSLQIKQQLGTQALSIANQAPSSLLSLFR